VLQLSKFWPCLGQLPSYPHDVCGMSGGRLQKKCIGWTNTESLQDCYNYTLLEGKRPRPVEEHEEFSRERLKRRSFAIPRHQRRATQMHCVKTHNANSHKHCGQMGRNCGAPCSSICHDGTLKEVCQYRLRVRLTVTPYTRHSSAADHGISQRSCVRERQNNNYKNGT
jgi:hypothetical protein